MSPEITAVDELFPEVENLYAHPSVHRELLFDEERMQKYSEAIRRVVKKGDTVMFSPYIPKVLTINGKEYLIMEEEDIYCIL